jgi:tRNA (cmo5U34)-methyltransferase
MDTDNTTPHDASDYDRAIRQTIPHYDAIQLETIDLVRAVKPDVTCWLDTGCGTGYLVELALPLFPATRFLLTDSSGAMLCEAGRRFENITSYRVALLPPTGTEDLTALDLGARPQVVTAILSHHYLGVSGRQRAIRSCFRVMEDGGVFIAFENIDFGPPASNEIGLERWCRYQSQKGKAPAAVESHRKRFKTSYFPITIDEHLKLLKATGFRNAGMFWLSCMQAGFFAIK